MTPSRYIKLDGLDLFVFDKVFDDDVIMAIDKQVRSRPFSSNHSSTKTSEEYREWASRYKAADFLEHPLHNMALQRLNQLYPDLEFEFWNIHCNNTTFGDWAFSHQDSTEVGAYSALYYANHYWEPNWFSETVFYSNNEPVVSISVRPGRLVVFDSRIKHRAGVPAMNCHEQRFTLSLRFNSDRNAVAATDLQPEVFN
ncbi:TPA: hypothetical protein ACVOYK_004501 [Vibrio diabolicus]